MNRIIVENDTMRFYSNPVPIPVGGSQWSKIFFMFSDEWEDLRKIAQFRQGELKINVDIDSNNFCYVPTEMLPDMCGELSIVGYPQDTSSAVIATTNSLMLSFVQGFESGGNPAVPPTPDLYQKLIKEFAESGGRNPDAVLYSAQELTEEQQKQARQNIGALDENIETTLVDTNRTFFGVGKNIVYVKNGWLKPCPVDADKELAGNYANAVLGFGFINTNISVVKGEAKSAFSLYQQGLISDKGTILKNPLDVAQYITWTVGTINNKIYIDYRHVEHSGFYEYCRYFEDDTYSYPIASYSLSNNMSDSEPYGSVAQYTMFANPTEDMHIATKQYVDTAKTEAQQLGLTSATPGQIIKVKTVDADGKLTAWEAAEMTGGGDRLIAHYTVPSGN